MSYLRQIIDYFFHHTFSGELEKRVHQRLVQSGDEPEREEAFRSLWREADEAQLPQAAVDRSFQVLQEKLQLPLSASSRTGKVVRFPGWLKMAASYVIPILLLSVSAYLYRESRQVQPRSVELMSHFVPYGKRDMLILPDSSRVWLNAGSTLFYPASFSGSIRQVYLSGEGYFEIQKDKNCPFVVRSKAVDIEVLGTRFNLMSYNDSDRIYTTLEEGSVCVRLHNVQRTTYHLSPDEQLVYQAGSGKAEIRQVVSADYSDWREGGLLFDNYSFNQIIPIIERSYGVKIHVKNSSYSSNKLTIHFNKDESIENVWMLLKELIPEMDYQIVGKEIYIE